ncbi:uncharacterized protein LOC143844499 isoform X2 [Paroedura picta]|uniref:uncharacterized protein LOC143844499 isoform X2 n=1 Tax=Paroedura picta TaxID=143630 RepID=UPI004055C04A
MLSPAAAAAAATAAAAALVSGARRVRKGLCEKIKKCIAIKALRDFETVFQKHHLHKMKYHNLFWQVRTRYSLSSRKH